jgi:hypothetical protein
MSFLTKRARVASDVAEKEEQEATKQITARYEHNA